MKFRCILAPEGYPEGPVYSFNTVEERKSFDSGVGAGSGAYGAGGCYVIFEEAIDEALDEHESINATAEEVLAIFAKEWR